MIIKLAIKNAMLLMLLAAVGFAAPAPSTQPSEKKDTFHKNSVWKGREKNPEGKHSWPASVKVVKRDGEKVTFNFWTQSDDGRKGAQLEGTIVDCEIKAKATKKLPGDEWHETIAGSFFSGSVDGKKLVLNRKSQHGGALTAEMTLQEKEKE
jgi:hypothetical protein